MKIIKVGKFLNEYKKEGFTQDFTDQENNLIMIYPNFKYQKIVGFGGAFTESSAYVFSKLKDEYKESFIKDYFSTEEGIGYNFCRTHINSCDFSLSQYAYSEKENLSDFSIEHDKKYLIPLIKKALETNKDIKLVSTPWSPPKFMKTNDDMCNGGKIKDNCRKLWSKYLAKYIKEYKKEGIKIDYITTQNEPNAKQLWESCQLTTEEEAELVLKYIIPTFKRRKIKTKVLIWDHNKERLFLRADQIFKMDKEKQIAGIGYHYYTGDHFENIEKVREKYKNKLIIHTEGCTGFSLHRSKRETPNAEIYAHDIIGDLNAGANGYIDWNILLDYKGGPNHAFNFCCSPMMSNFWKNKYNKTLSYYYIGHFSKYIKRGARRIGFSKFTDKIEVTAFENPDKEIVVILLNRTDNDERFSLVLGDKVHKDKVRNHSITTYVIKPL